MEGLLAEASLGAGAIAGVVGEVGRAAESPTARDVIGSPASASGRWPATGATETQWPWSERWRTSTRGVGGGSPDGPGSHPGRRRGAVRPGAARDLAQGRGRIRSPALASALFSRIEVLGIREATVHLSAHAVRHGLAAALPAELRILVNGRGERDSPATNDLPITMRLAEPPEPSNWLKSA